MPPVTSELSEEHSRTRDHGGTSHDIEESKVTERGALTDWRDVSGYRRKVTEKG